MPLPISLAHKLSKRLTDVRKQNIIEYLRPDGKVQVTVEYEGSVPKRIDTIVVSTQHKEDANLDQLKKDIKEYVINAVVPKELLDDKTKYFINPTGRFVIGGPLGDSGLTGRKIIIDTYGGYSRHGGGSFSGKDATKVDRSAAYMLRYIAKNIIANKLANKCEIQISYAIGIEEPLSIYVNTFGTGKITDEEIIKMIKEKFALLKKHVNECDNKLELNQIFLYLTSFNSEDINTLIHNIGGVTGLETLKVNNSKNELLCYYIDEIIKVIRIKINYNSNTDAIK